MSELVKLYNPANASTLTKQQIDALQDLTSPQIKELAIAYPNAAMQRNYLLIIDNKKPIHKQLPALSSFESLYNLRERNGMRQYVPYAFRAGHKPVIINPKAKKVEVVDLSDTELLHLPGFKKPMPEPESGQDSTVKVKRVKRVKK